MAWLWRAFRELAIQFVVRMQLISPISLSKTFPSIGAKLFYLGSSSLRIYRLSYLG